jgi:hypothetical protein
MHYDAERPMNGLCDGLKNFGVVQFISCLEASTSRTVLIPASREIGSVFHNTLPKLFKRPRGGACTNTWCALAVIVLDWKLGHLLREISL